jgi:hypothetical protein
LKQRADAMVGLPGTKGCSGGARWSAVDAMLTHHNCSFRSISGYSGRLRPERRT